MKLPYFSIIIATHHRPELLTRALQSIRQSSYKDYELIVVTDCPDVNTMQVAGTLLNEHDTFIKRIGKQGPAISRNLGLQHARGRYVMFLDDDDAFAPDYLELASNATQQYPGMVLYTDYFVIEENSPDAALGAKAYNVSLAAHDIQTLYVKNFILNHCAIFPREAVQGREQDPHLSSLDDWDFLLNVATETGFQHVNISGAIVYKDYANYRIRRGSTAASNGWATVSDYLTVYKKWPAPNLHLRLSRQRLLASAGQNVPLEWV
jgi:glycosyltransferase involved in cell wall biosynthesis